MSGERQRNRCGRGDAVSDLQRYTDRGEGQATPAEEQPVEPAVENEQER